MAGSAAGALLVVLLLPLYHTGRLIVLLALVPLLAWPAAPTTAWGATGTARRRRLAVLIGGSALGAAALGMLLWDGGAWVTVRPSPYKALSQALQMPGSRIVESVTDIRGRIDTLESPMCAMPPA